MHWHRRWEFTQTDLNLLRLKFSCFFLLRGERLMGKPWPEHWLWEFASVSTVFYTAFVTFGLNEMYKRDNRSTIMYELKLGYQQCPRYSHMRICSIFLSCNIYVKSYSFLLISTMHFVLLQLLEWPYEV